ncbi:gamma-glutamyltransferase [Noviherbaspirillum sp. DKR-6]|uniref:Glutathione hydrolase proenzyme n=2 Tax=Noviherbaspirillum pedocola TaxID=2801341 RepID=A0A934SYU0_9BURK|nr:gamma-glutamyltransferase [Noviherbaspirillum pedocola]MBK4735437.1 gamma-glutamyltransferase [Noviherbaspirillum pedocola]
MVTSPHELASRAGLDVLAAGGNAVEASIAIAACLAVTYPHFTGLGGDGFLLISDAAGKVVTISGIGQAASRLPPWLNGMEAIPQRGPQSMLTTAGNVDALGQAFEYSRDRLGGKLSWSDLLAPAIALARDGFPHTPSADFWLRYRAGELDALPGVRTAFHGQGAAPRVGEAFSQPRLARTLETLAERGYRDFYEGQLAERMAQGLREAGSPLTAADLAATRARIEPPLAQPYRGGLLLAHQPPTQGVTTLEIMGILERFDLASVPEGSADYYHLLVEAVKLAFIDRDRCLADPDFAAVPCERLLGADALDRAAARVDPARARPWPHPFRPGDTAFVAAADEHGNAVSMLQTIYFDWGSGVMAGDTGVIWHNRGAAFSLNPAHPNCIAPGKRPFHTLNPGIYLREGAPRLLYGTQGADGQPQTLAAILTRMIDYGMDPLTALSRPRFLLGRTFSDSRDTLKLERDAGADVFAELESRGHETSVLPAQSPLAGHPGAIVIDRASGTMTGAHDPRSDGRALGL